PPPWTPSLAEMRRMLADRKIEPDTTSYSARMRQPEGPREAKQSYTHNARKGKEASRRLSKVPHRASRCAILALSSREETGRYWRPRRPLRPRRAFRGQPLPA